MNALGFRLILLLILAFLAQGCGEDQVEKSRPKPSTGTDRIEKERAASPTNQDIILDLKSRLMVSREELDRQKTENRNLQDRLESVTRKLHAVESEAEKLRADLSKAAPRSSKSFPDRVNLMGAKALAEFKAKQLSQRVEKLSQDLESKESELAGIRENALQKEQAVAKLTKKIE
jgi:chromosome segregation ATPase